MSVKKVRIMVDTASDLLPEKAAELSITLLPIKVRFGEEEFDDGITISRDLFYNRMIETGEIPKTSLISPDYYAEAFRKAVDAGDEVVCLTVSSALSGCYQSAMLAAADFAGSVFVVDTLQVCGPEYLLAERAASLRDCGLCAKEIASVITAERSRPRVIALFDTLEYLKYGGRISAAAACIGGAFCIKPVLTIENGVIQVVGKARGSRNGNNYLIHYIRKCGGIDWDMPMLLSWSGLSDSLLEKYVRDSAGLYAGHRADELPRTRIGATVGTYAGPGAIAVSFYPKEPEDKDELVKL